MFTARGALKLPFVMSVLLICIRDNPFPLLKLLLLLDYFEGVLL